MMGTKLRLAATAVAFIAFAVFGFSTPASAAETASYCTDIGEGDLCIYVENGFGYHAVAVGYAKDEGAREAVNLAYFGIDFEEHRAGTWRNVSAGERIIEWWEWDHRSPSGCYSPGLYYGPDQDLILGWQVCI